MKYEQTTPMEPVTFTIVFDNWWRHPTQFSIKCIALDEAIAAFMTEHADAANTISEIAYYHQDGRSRRFTRLEIEVALEDYCSQLIAQRA